MYLEEIRERLRTSSKEKKLRIGWEFLEQLGLSEFCGCDLDIEPIVNRIPSDVDLIDVKSFLQHTLVEALFDRLESGCSSLLLDIERMKHTPASVLIPLIEKQRNEEIANAIVQIQGREFIQYDVYMNEVREEFVPKNRTPVRLENLWLTAHGCDILSELGVGLQTDLKGLKQIRKLLMKSGIQLQVSRGNKLTNSLPSKMSSAYRSIVLQSTKSHQSN